ncbi:MAG TPA: Ada metal-binding domain-containing protein [Ohtaekwangia sp.]|nr:Ada metal-binding domain-containing protein [Ohtaekwangia sp.]
MIQHTDLTSWELLHLIRRNIITLAGNKKLKIAGSLHCRSGKRMQRKNRVFFSSMNDALNNGYRPCKHCIKIVR